MTENPQWKLPERRVARYLKRQLKARKDPLADEIEADMDEETVYTMTESIVAARKEDDEIIRPDANAYAEENEVVDDGKAKEESKPLFCEGCVIS